MGGADKRQRRGGGDGSRLVPFQLVGPNAGSSDEERKVENLSHSFRSKKLERD